MKKIGILGGTFDPPHFGHLLIANEVLESLDLDGIWFLPNQEPPHKKKSNVSNQDRIQMLKKAIEGNEKFQLETMELERPGPSYTYDTVKLLQSKHTDIQFYFIIGADMVEYLPKWYKIDELVQLIHFVGVKRPSYNVQTSYPILYVDVPEFDISSSMIRNRLKEGKTVRYLLPDTVINYMEAKQLYGTN
ncbi:nicotinate-nucleotide adenylyltransferase (plasmid) [Bacillus sp. 31A1R]|uniref:Probable nicotinate-nucleotide adenylyltransferase n=1 Tax=Robertmurraya mangrovi TaxID=3098077 RepID=A0ABU5IUY1_9BACI|nr:nicotinate-nucleotide adenylyltransferase [Bacillus sp. 31A1R]MDZ5470911.1 nicotinate-nucleotide adenylyltransferase [Bacillus sp. 31A1R]